jgi:hypothetical protein
MRHTLRERWALTLLLSGTLILGLVFVQHTALDGRRAVERDLMIIADFKAQLISNWHQEVRLHAATLRESIAPLPEMNILLEARVGPPTSLAGKPHISHILAESCLAHDSLDIQVVDRAGRILLSQSHSPEPVDSFI